MSEEASSGAWLEATDGTRTSVRGVCSLGRSSKNTIVLEDDRASRRHAMINAQGLGEFWLVDLGTVNGTYVNGRRVIQPCRLNDGDRIELAGSVFTYRQPPAPEREDSSGSMVMTRQDIRPVDCWLMVSDIENSTQLIRSLPADEVARFTGRWLGECKRIVEQHGGAINKFLGDGFFAFWLEKDEAATAVAGALGELKRLQAADAPRFRIALHYGEVLLGGAASLGEDCLMGSEVNFVFRMEKVAASLSASCLLSEPAVRKLGNRIEVTSLGLHPVHSFEGRHHFFSA